MRIAWLIVVAASCYSTSVSSTGTGELFTYQGVGPSSWNTLYSTCSNTGATQQSPISVPTVSGANVIIPVTMASAAAVGTPLLVPFKLHTDGGYATLNLAFASTTAAANGTTYRANRVVIRRPPEHAPDATTLARYGATLNNVIEQQTYWSIGNATKLIVSQLAFVSDSSTSPFASDGFPLLAVVANALRGGASFASLRALSSNLGFGNSNYYTYRGTSTSPPCETVQWLVDPTLYRVTSDVIDAGLPIGIPRPLQALNGNAALSNTVIGITVASPAVVSAAVNSSSPLRAWNISLDFGSSGGAVKSMSRYIMYQTMVGMLASMCGALILVILALFFAKFTYRSPARSVWTHPKYGLQRFGFSDSALLHDLNADSDEEEEEEGGDGSASGNGDEEDED